MALSEASCPQLTAGDLLTHNTTFSGHFALPNFGRPFIIADGLTSDSGNSEKWDKSVIPARFIKCRLPTRADIRTFGRRNRWTTHIPESMIGAPVAALRRPPVWY